MERVLRTGEKENKGVHGRAKSGAGYIWCEDEAAKWDRSGMIKWLYSHVVERKFVLEKAEGWLWVTIIYFLNDEVPY